MAEVYCSILHVSNYWLRERILSFLFEKEEIGCDYRRITRLSNSVKIHAVTPYQQTNVESPGQQKPEIGKQVNVAIILISLDIGLVPPEMLISKALRNKEFLKDEKVPVIVICTTKYPNEATKRQIDYDMLGSQRDQFVYVMPTLVLPKCIVKKIENPNDDSKIRRRRPSRVQHCVI